MTTEEKKYWCGFVVLYLLYLILVCVCAVTLSGCGNTIQGFGTDIVETGKKISDWQNEKKEVKPSQ
jgi:predicted small secreted protein